MNTKTYIQVISIAALLVGGYFQTHRAGVDVEMVTDFQGVVGWLLGTSFFVSLIHQRLGVARGGAWSHLVHIGASVNRIGTEAKAGNYPA